MLNKLLASIRRFSMLSPGDRVICAVSGGADSVALLFAMYLLREKLQIQVEAAHFNHNLRGAESHRDEQFVRSFCQGYGIPLHMDSGRIVPGKKGLEAAAREARYAFLAALPGKIATAHTADDNAETVLMHLIRGTGLRGLGGITPVSGNVIRPMLDITRQEVMAFLREYSLGYVEDSSNASDAFLRNRIRHRIMPLLKEENPRIAENLSEMARHLREDEDALCVDVDYDALTVPGVQKMHPAHRSRVLVGFLKHCGIPEPESQHIQLLERLVFSDNPSAKAAFPGGVVITRNYQRLEICHEQSELSPMELACPGQVLIPQLGLKIICAACGERSAQPNRFTVSPQGKIYVRSRLPGDVITLSGGTKTVKKLFVDKKIPAAQRPGIPVIADDAGVLGVYGLGVNLQRLSSGVEIRFETIDPSEEL